MPEVQIDNRAFYKRLKELSFPIIFQSLMLALVAAGDALMLGRVSQEAMTAVSLATQVQFVQNMFLMAITGAGAILGAQYWGKGDSKTLKNLFNLMLAFAGVLSLVFFTACELFPGALMHIFAGDEELIRIGSAYLRIAGWSYLLTGISQSYLTIMKVTDHVRESAFVSSSAVILNILFNAIFIFGLLGAPRMEERGAALATTLSRVIELVLCLYISRGERYIRPGWTRRQEAGTRDKGQTDDGTVAPREGSSLGSEGGRPRLWHKQLFIDFSKQCFPLMGGSLFWGVGFTSYTAIMGHLGVDAAAANSVAAVVRDLICCACNGVGSAAGIMVGNELGAGRLEMGKAYGIKLKNLSYVIGFASTALVLALTPLVVRMVILSEAAKGYLTGMMVIMAIYMIGRCVNTVTINGILDGGGDTVFDMYSLAVCMWGIAIPLALLGAFVFHWPVLLVYACTCLDEVGKIPWVMIRFRKYKWVRNLTK